MLLQPDCFLLRYLSLHLLLDILFVLAFVKPGLAFFLMILFRIWVVLFLHLLISLIVNKEHPLSEFHLAFEFNRSRSLLIFLACVCLVFPPASLLLEQGASEGLLLTEAFKFIISLFLHHLCYLVGVSSINFLGQSLALMNSTFKHEVVKCPRRLVIGLFIIDFSVA